MAEQKKETPIWESWPLELPSCDEEIDMSLYNILNDENAISAMHKEIREIAIKEFRSKLSFDNTAVLIAGGSSASWSLYDSDTNKAAFRQEANFRYFFGINEPDCYGLIDLSAKVKAAPTQTSTSTSNSTKLAFKKQKNCL